MLPWWHLVPPELNFSQTLSSPMPFSYGNVSLQHVNETMYLLWNLPFFKIVSPKTNFWLIIVQQTSIHINYFMVGRWHTLCHSISKMHTVGEGPGETPSALRCLSYLIRSFLTDIKQLAITSKGGTLQPASDVCVRSFPCPFSL